MDLTEPVTLQVGKEGTLLHTKMFIVLALIGNIQADTFKLQAVEMGRVQVLRSEAPPRSGCRREIGSLST